MKKSDLSTFCDIKLMVDSFYTKVRNDELLAPIFEERIGSHWKEHLEKMYRFWQTILHEEHTYYGSPFPPHASMPITQKHFERWLAIFNENLNTHFEGELAKEAAWRAEKMAQMFAFKIDFLRNKNS